MIRFNQFIKEHNNVNITPETNMKYRGELISIRDIFGKLKLEDSNKLIQTSVKDIEHIYDSLLYFTDHGYSISFYSIELIKNKLLYNVRVFPNMEPTKINRFTGENGKENYEQSPGVREWQSDSYNLEVVRSESDIERWIKVNENVLNYLKNSIPFLKERFNILKILKSSYSIEITLKDK
jgi:hypothetical protein